MYKKLSTYTWPMQPHVSDAITVTNLLDQYVLAERYPDWDKLSKQGITNIQFGNPHFDVDTTTVIALKAICSLLPYKLKIHKVQTDLGHITWDFAKFFNIDANEDICRLGLFALAPSNFREAQQLLSNRDYQQINPHIITDINKHLSRKEKYKLFGIYKKPNNVVILTTKEACFYSSETLPILSFALSLLIPKQVYSNQIAQASRNLFEKITKEVTADSNCNYVGNARMHNRITEALRAYVRDNKGFFEIAPPKSIADYLKEHLEKRISDAQSRVENAKANAAQLEEKLEKTYAELNEYMATVVALQNFGVSDIQKNYDDAMKLLKDCEYVPQDAYFEDGILYINTVQPIFVNNPVQWENTGRNTVYDDSVRELLDKVFIDETVKLYVWATVKLDFDKFQVSRSSDDNFDRILLNKHALPSQHLMTYNCFGTNKTAILNRLSTGDIPAAVEQIIEAAGALNPYDSVVVRSFTEKILTNAGVECFEYQNKMFSLNDYKEGKITF